MTEPDASIRELWDRHGARIQAFREARACVPEHERPHFIRAPWYLAQEAGEHRQIARCAPEEAA